MNHVDETRHVLTERGMRFLAARADVPAATFERYGGVTFVSREQSRHGRLIQHREHEIGVNRFFAQLAGDARAAGWHLAEWRNEAESTHRFMREDGRTSWIRPDGSGVLVRGAESRPFFLEYDRGTLDAGDYRAKFEGYLRYYGAGEWEGNFPCEPALLFVCSDDRSEERALRATRSLEDVSVYLTAEWLFNGLGTSAHGVLGAIWRSARAQSADRMHWPTSDHGGELLVGSP